MGGASKTRTIANIHPTKFHLTPKGLMVLAIAETMGVSIDEAGKLWSKKFRQKRVRK